VIAANVFATVPTLETERLRLEPLGPEHFEGSWSALHDEEGMRLTGTTASFTREQIRTWLATRAEQHDRADWAILLRETGEYVGEVVLNDLEPEIASMNVRIALRESGLFGRGYGTEALRAVVDHGLDVVGLHRITLDVFGFNPRARRVYEKCGFVYEGTRRDEIQVDGIWHDSILMSILETDARPWRHPTGSGAQRS
jgi:RimJ/RimL family protein N-acetyltransferase